MTGKRSKVNSSFLVLLVFMEFAISKASESCPPGQFYFNNSTDVGPTDVNITTTITPGANCYNCSSYVPLCDHCYYNYTSVVCLNCTDGWLPKADGGSCLRETTPQASSFPWWGGILIALAIIGVAVGSIGGYCWWRNRRMDQDLPDNLPDPDGKDSFKKINGEKKKKRNSYIKEPTRSVPRIPASVYGQTDRRSQEGHFSNSLFSEVKENVTPSVIPKGDPGACGSPEGSSGPLYENFRVKSKYPKNEIEMNQEIYMNT